MLYQINCIFRAGLCYSDATQNKNEGVVQSCCFWNVGGNCEVDFLRLLCIMGSVSAALPFCKNIALVIYSHCKYLRLRCVYNVGEEGVCQGQQFLLLFCLFGERGQNVALVSHMVCWVSLKSIAVTRCNLISVRYSSQSSSAAYVKAVSGYFFPLLL